MKKTNIFNIVLSGAALVGLQACALQGSHSFTPTGITLNKSVKMGTHAIHQEERPIVRDMNNRPYVSTNNYYQHTVVNRCEPTPDYIFVSPRY